MSLRVVKLLDGRRAIIIRTSDRISFKKCRRSWGWSSHLKGNLGSKNLSPYLWFGSAVHFALEDFHGFNRFQRIARAFQAYCIATSKQNSRELPDDAQELYKLGTALLDYYQDHWLKRRKIRPIYVEDGIPQVEVSFEIPIPLDEHPMLADYAERQGADCVLYRGTLDGVVYDHERNGLLIKEYKTAKVAEQMHYQTDPQVTTYCWAGDQIYSLPVLGVEYWQFIKHMPEVPRPLSSGKLSTRADMWCSYPLYLKAIENLYGDYSIAPNDVKERLAQFGRSEDDNRDRFIMRETIFRNEHMKNAEAIKILLELEDMLNPNLPLYPNPTRDCSRMCSFLATCVTMDDGGDWEYELAAEFSQRDQDPDRYWRRRLPSLDQLVAMVDAGQAPDLHGIQTTLRNAEEDRRAAIEAGEPAEFPTFSM